MTDLVERSWNPSRIRSYSPTVRARYGAGTAPPARCSASRRRGVGAKLDLIIPEHLRIVHRRDFGAAMASGALRLVGVRPSHAWKPKADASPTWS
jgi:hypothetical protein